MRAYLLEKRQVVVESLTCFVEWRLLMEAKVEEREAGADEKERYCVEDKGSCAPGAVRITCVDVDAGPSPLRSALDLTVDFVTDDDLRDAAWHLKYLVDSVYTRHIICE